MKCPRCSYDWDIRQSSCPRCGLHIRASSLRRSTNSPLPMSASLPNNSVASPPTVDRTAQVRSPYLQKPTSDNLAQSQFPMPFNKLQQSRFPLPSTGELAPQKRLSPLLGD